MLEICEAPVIWTGTVYGPAPTRSSLPGGISRIWPDAAPCATAAAGTEVVPGMAELPGGITGTPAGAGDTTGCAAFAAACAAPVGGRPGVGPIGGRLAAPGVTAGAPTAATPGAPTGSPAGGASSAMSGGGPVRPRFDSVPM